MFDDDDPAQFMIDNTFTAFALVNMALEDRGDDLETALTDIDLTHVPGVLRPAVILAGQEMAAARGLDEAIRFTRDARPSN